MMLVHDVQSHKTIIVFNWSRREARVFSLLEGYSLLFSKIFTWTVCLAVRFV